MKHSLSPSFETAVHHFPFLSFCFSGGRTDATEKQAGTQPQSLGTHLTPTSSLSAPIIDTRMQQRQTRSTTQNPSQMQAGQICPPHTSEGRGGARCHGRYLQAFFCPPPLALTSGLSTPLCFSFFRQPINADRERPPERVSIEAIRPLRPTANKPSSIHPPSDRSSSWSGNQGA